VASVAALPEGSLVVSLSGFGKAMEPRGEIIQAVGPILGRARLAIVKCGLCLATSVVEAPDSSSSSGASVLIVQGGGGVLPSLSGISLGVVGMLALAGLLVLCKKPFLPGPPQPPLGAAGSAPPTPHHSARANAPKNFLM